MKLNEFAKGVHQNAVEHGWWEDQRTFGEIVSLCHSELSEALEEFRAKRGMVGISAMVMCVICWNVKAARLGTSALISRRASPWSWPIALSAFWTGSARKRWIRMLCWPKRRST